MFTFNPDMLLLSDGICCLILHRGGRYTHQWIINFSIKVVTTCSRPFIHQWRDMFYSKTTSARYMHPKH
ncbi:hypothetical protein ABKN59_011966 [Abortiporus biennis]